ncbi:uncharacterized protein LOC121373453 [Gigantopelta aegis]|uniref:uncharacterized protein LOC121373453 n=1 Tax=Gigantopelta aegis TaxID=1735272 RepID=UPI001B88981F|nr:uncharacterized protein LOC121373453 [Gigantopelta aegis]
MNDTYDKNTTEGLFKNEENETRCKLDLGDNVCVVAKLWKGDIAIHVRQFDEDRVKHFPTKKGVSLTMNQWLELATFKRETSQHLGGNVYVERSYAGVDIRQWWYCDQELKSSRRGVRLTAEQ